MYTEVERICRTFKNLEQHLRKSYLLKSDLGEGMEGQSVLANEVAKNTDKGSKMDCEKTGITSES